MPLSNFHAGHAGQGLLHLVAQVTHVSVRLWKAPEAAHVSAAVMCGLQTALTAGVPEFEYPRILISETEWHGVQGRSCLEWLKYP